MRSPTNIGMGESKRWMRLSGRILMRGCGHLRGLSRE